MTNPFFDHPILNSPYEYPAKHWELDEQGQPTQQTINLRRRAEFISPIPKPKKRKGSAAQQPIVFDEGQGLSTQAQQYDYTAIINAVRQQVDQWRSLPNPTQWHVTPETARLLQHWRHHPFSDIRPFFCQVEAVETAIWLTEVAPNAGNVGKSLLEYLANANHDANPGLMRLALKLATGAGKTTVMAMLIAWQTINAVRRPNSTKFTRGFLIVAPGLTICDRLRVLQPHDPDSYYASRELIPSDMQGDLERAKIVITNYHAFRLRERMELSKGGRSLLQGRGQALNTLETEGQMLQRVMPDLMGLKNILVINDEAHHCYREKPGQADDGDLTGDDRKEAEQNNEAARVWISGLEVVTRKLGVTHVIDLSATPFFLRGSGYAEGTLFPWTMSDFSLMDAIECGIVKLPRVPVADNIPGGEMPKFRNLWEHIRTRMPKKGRGKAKNLDPLSLPVELQTALEALYGHYQKTYELWAAAGISVPPCFIVVCNNTSTSKLVYDQQCPLMTCVASAPMGADRAVRVAIRPGRLWQRRSRGDSAGGPVARRPLASWGHRCPHGWASTGCAGPWGQRPGRAMTRPPSTRAAHRWRLEATAEADHHARSRSHPRRHPAAGAGPPPTLAAAAGPTPPRAAARPARRGAPRDRPGAAASCRARVRSSPGRVRRAGDETRGACARVHRSPNGRGGACHGRAPRTRETGPARPDAPPGAARHGPGDRAGPSRPPGRVAPPRGQVRRAPRPAPARTARQAPRRCARGDQAARDRGGSPEAGQGPAAGLR